MKLLNLKCWFIGTVILSFVCLLECCAIILEWAVGNFRNSSMHHQHGMTIKLQNMMVQHRIGLYHLAVACGWEQGAQLKIRKNIWIGGQDPGIHVTREIEVTWKRKFTSIVAKDAPRKNWKVTKMIEAKRAQSHAQSVPTSNQSVVSTLTGNNDDEDSHTYSSS